MKAEIVITSNNGDRFQFLLPERKENNLPELNRNESYPDWALLKRNKCANCPLQSLDSRWCPVAVKIVEITEQYPSLASYEWVTYESKTAHSSFKETVSTQDAMVQLLFQLIEKSACPVVYPETWTRDYFHPKYNLKGVLFRRITLKLLAYHIGEIKGKSISKYLNRQASLGIVLESLNKRIEHALEQQKEETESALTLFYGVLRMMKDGYEEFILDDIENKFIQGK